MPIERTIMESPLGILELVASAGAITQINFCQNAPTGELAGQRSIHRPLLREATRQIEAYFSGKRHDFSLPLQPEGTAFQMQVWNAVREIPFGSTATYGEIAQRIGRPQAARAVGAANGCNPLPIVIPCHRVVGCGGRLTGYGGGLAAKHHLLSLEGAILV
jgi:methylated-DNA-[protein]-cysteine S-methyltransferase